jgi:hydrogenase expression/formation protein HypD
VTILEASRRELKNYFVMSNHIRIIPAIKAILDSKDLQLDGFIGPGHVGTVIGNHPYAFVASDYQKPLVTAGFEPLDILESVMRLLEQKSSGRCEVENQYTRAVKDEGNPRAMDVIEKVFEIRPHFEWRGLGSIAHSALKLRAEFASFDAELRYEVPGVKIADPKACQCGEVLRGAIRPWECKVFGTACTPETPIGTCMVSSEGACAAYYNYGRFNKAPRIPVRVG